MTPEFHLLQQRLQVFRLGHSAGGLDLAVHHEGGGDHHAEVGEAHHVGDFFQFVVEAEVFGCRFGGFGQLVAFGTAGAEDLDLFNGFIGLVGFRVDYFWVT